MVEYGAGYGNNPLSRLSRLTCAGCKANPAKDFVRTPGVEVVTAETAFRPSTNAAPVATVATVGRTVTPARAAGALGLVGLVALAWRRRTVLA